MRYEKEDYIEVAKLPFTISKAVIKGIGRILVDHLNEWFYGGEEELSTDEWRRFEEGTRE